MRKKSWVLSLVYLLMLGSSFPEKKLRQFSAREKKNRKTEKNGLREPGTKTETMLLKIRKWLTIAGAFMFIVSVTYTAFTIDSSLKSEALKKFKTRKKEMELVKPASKSSPSSSSSGSTATKLTAAAAAPTTAPPHSDKASEALPKIKVTGH